MNKSKYELTVERVENDLRFSPSWVFTPKNYLTETILRSFITNIGVDLGYPTCDERFDSLPVSKAELLEAYSDLVEFSIKKINRLITEVTGTLPN